MIELKVPKFLHEIRYGNGTRARSMRSAAFVVLGFGGKNVLRLGGNLILTRMLFPEAFGLMALVQIFLVGLQMFSDIGINTSIMRDPRGEERDFLNTAWTLQIIRGGILWLLSCAVAWPAATLYDEPRLLYLIPVSGLAAAITGFRPTKVALANRHLQVGVQVMSELIGQALGLIFMISLTFVWQDVWGLVVGGLFGSLMTVLLQRRLIPGENDKLHWDRDAAAAVFRFGRFIFLGSMAFFVSDQGDRAVLGKYITLDQLGVYTVGVMMANMPLMMVQAASDKVGFPIYRRLSDLSIEANRQKVFRARRLIVFGGLAVSCTLALISVPMIHFLYDARYGMSGPILILVSVSGIIRISVSNYDGAYMSKGDSRSHFHLTWVNAVLQTGLLILGVSQFGILGAALASGLTMILTYPLRVIIVRRYHAWDPLCDAGSLVLGLTLIGLSIWIWQAEMREFIHWSLEAL